jgi:hypothetical protein
MHEEAAEVALSAINDGELRLGIGRLFADAQGEIDDGNVDLVIIAARRLSCLYRLLLRAGMPPLQGCLVVSNRLLDANPQLDWAATRVLVLDDSVIVGTTLYRLHNELVELGASQVMFRAVCLDREQRVEYFFESLDFRTLFERTSDQVESLSTEIVKLLFAHQVPYFTDYPTTVPTEIGRDAWRHLLSTDDWLVADVTAPLLEDGEHSALSLVPTLATFDRYLRRVPPQAAALIDVFKLRVYAEESDTSVRVVAVPIAILAPCAPATLDSALDAVCAATLGNDEHTRIPFRDWKPQAKHRLLQLYLSACVLAEAWPLLSQAAGGEQKLPEVDVLEREHVRLYFGDLTDAVLEAFPAVVTAYVSSEGAAELPVSIRLDRPTPSRLLDDESLQDLLWDTREMVAATGLPAEPSAGQITKLGMIFAHAIAAVFGFIDREFERRERLEIAALPDAATYRTRFEDPDRRLLRQGLTMRELAETIAPDCLTGPPWRRSLVSLGVDAGNDLGIIVPVTRYDHERDIVYRCYRLGETANLARIPLPEAVQSTEATLDEFASAVQQGYPVSSSVTSVDEALDRARVRPDLGSIHALVDAVGDAVRGAAVSRFLGTVTAVRGERFEAELISPARDDQRVADMSLDQVPLSDGQGLLVGTRFLWSVRQRDVGGARERTSRVRLIADSPIDPKRVRATAEALREGQRAADSTGP